MLALELNKETQLCCITIFILGIYSGRLIEKSKFLQINIWKIKGKDL